MPRIDIYENDITRATGDVVSDVVFIPGFTNKPDAPTEPWLCTTVSELEQKFGATPAIFTLTPDAADSENHKFTFDTSYVMAKELLATGMPVLYYGIQYNGANDPATEIMDAYLQIAADLEDKTEYTIKYITTGGYANFDQTATDVNNMILANICTLAQKRGDAVALVQPKYIETEPLTGADSLYEYLQTTSAFDATGSFGTMFAPYGTYALTNGYNFKVVHTDGETYTLKITNAQLPGCFGYLATLAANMKTSPNYLAFAGVNRGMVPNLLKLNTSRTLTNKIADSYQPLEGTSTNRIAINAVTNIKPYGLTIWGNRTLLPVQPEGLVAGNFLNIRNMVSDIKKVAYRAAKELMFEQNDDILWLNFKSEVMPFLENLKSGRGISDYRLIKLPTKHNGGALGKGEFACAIKIYPIYAVESFEITVVLSDADVSVGE